ncbi:MAG: cytochrome oxidase subunit III [Flavobacteriales bacterium]|nr:cytochrome oxidase subunit III [Flavobacteriales bacterium]
MSDKETYGKAWEGGDKPYESSYGKLMMWFFLITDTLTFSAFLAAYGFSRFKFEDVWPIAEEVFTHFPFLNGEHPLLFVALMTFILIMSSVTMVLAVNFGHKMQKNKVILWLSLTIVGGIMFLGSQAWEWGHFIHGDKGGVETNIEYTVHIAEGEKLSSVYKLMDIDKYSDANENPLKYFALEDLTSEMKEGFDVQNIKSLIEKLEEKPAFNIRKANRTYLSNEESINYIKENATKVVVGANLVDNEYGHRLFADYFFFITGFHGFHVFSGVILLIIILINTIKGTYEKRGHYEMVEKVGLYWHFVDLVWVFVFTFFYLV